MVESGRVLAGRYELLARVGRGGMADVFRAFDRVLERRVAVKVLSADRAEDDSLFDRFRREARAAASLNHPNVVSVYDTGVDDDLHYIVMELVEGPSLVDILRREGPLEVSRAVEILRPVAAALAAAHAQGLVHRDVKPGNILFDRAGTPKVGDFGIARVVSAVTQTTSVYGSALYIAPEQASGVTVDERADVYALGCVLYEMLTGRPPFTGDTPLSVVYQHLHAAPEPPSRLRPGIPEAVDAVVLRALAKDPSDRYGQMEELRGDLDRLAAGLPPLAATGELDRTRPLGGAAETVLLGAAGAEPDPTAVIAPPSTVTREEEVLAAPPQRSRAVSAIIIGVVTLILAALAVLLVVALTRGEEPPPQPVAPTPVTSPTPTPQRQSPRPKASPKRSPSPSPASPSPSPPTPTPTPTPTASPLST